MSGTLFNEIIVAGSINNTGGSSGDLLVGDGTSMASLAIGSAGQVLTVSGSTAIWATPSSGSSTPWSNVVFTATVSPIATINTDRSRYTAVNDTVMLNIDIDVTTDGTGPSQSLTLSIPGGLGVPCAGPSGVKFTGSIIVSSGSLRQLAFASLDTGVGSGATITIESLGEFANTTAYTLRGQIVYEI